MFSAAGAVARWIAPLLTVATVAAMGFLAGPAQLGNDLVELVPKHLERLDFELEAAIVVGRRGRNLSIAQADEAQQLQGAGASVAEIVFTSAVAPDGDSERMVRGSSRVML